MTVQERTADALDLSFVPQPKSTVATAELDGEAVLYDEEIGSLHTLDPIGTVVWSCFDGTASLSEIAGELAAAFGTGAGTVADDVLALARQLGRQGVLHGVAADPEVLAEQSVEEAEEVIPTDDGDGC